MSNDNKNPVRRYIMAILGSKPSDANWKSARYGYKSWDDAWKALGGADSDSDSDSPLNDGNDELLVNSMIACENDENCILNGTKYKL